MMNYIKRFAKWVRVNPEMAVLWLIVATVVVMAVLLTGESGVLAAAVVPGVAGGHHVVDEPLTTDITREAAPGLWTSSRATPSASMPAR